MCTCSPKYKSLICCSWAKILEVHSMILVRPSLVLPWSLQQTDVRRIRIAVVSSAVITFQLWRCDGWLSCGLTWIWYEKQERKYLILELNVNKYFPNGQQKNRPYIYILILENWRVDNMGQKQGWIHILSGKLKNIFFNRSAFSVSPLGCLKMRGG